MHFAAASFTWTHSPPPEDRMDYYDNPSRPWKRRWRCKTCGANVASYNSKTDRWSVWGAQLSRDEKGEIERWGAVRPTAHIYYGTRMLDVGDELGKWEGYEGQSRRME